MPIWQETTPPLWLSIPLKSAPSFISPYAIRTYGDGMPIASYYASETGGNPNGPLAYPPYIRHPPE